jgi:hypothetical protein
LENLNAKLEITFAAIIAAVGMSIEELTRMVRRSSRNAQKRVDKVINALMVVAMASVMPGIQKAIKGKEFLELAHSINQAKGKLMQLERTAQLVITLMLDYKLKGSQTRVEHRQTCALGKDYVCQTDLVVYNDEWITGLEISMDQSLRKAIVEEARHVDPFYWVIPGGQPATKAVKYMLEKGCQPVWFREPVDGAISFNKLIEDLKPTFSAPKPSKKRQAVLRFATS